MKTLEVANLEDRYLELVGRIDRDERSLAEDADHSSRWLSRCIYEGCGNYGLFEAFVWDGQLRIHAVFAQDVGRDIAEQIASRVREALSAYGEAKDASVWCSQENPLLAAHLERSLCVRTTYRTVEFQYPCELAMLCPDIAPLTVKPYDDGLLDETLCLLEAAFVPILCNPRDFIDDREAMREKFAQRVNARYEAFFLGDMMIGFYWHRNGEIDYLAVAPAFQSKGYGAKILARALYTICEDPHAQPRLYCASHNERALRFYKRFGMTLTSQSIHFVLGGSSV